MNTDVMSNLMESKSKGPGSHNVHSEPDTKSKKHMKTILLCKTGAYVFDSIDRTAIILSVYLATAQYTFGAFQKVP